MTEDDRRHDDDRAEEAPPPRVKVTDRRRVRADGPAQAPPDESETPSGTAGPEDHSGSGQPPRLDPDGDAVLGVAETSGDDLEEARRQSAEYRDHLQRLAADFDNYRKRVLKEQTRAVEMASEPLVRRLLEVLDEFDLALMAAERKPDLDRFLHGVELVYAKLLDILRAEGVERIDAQGKPFDPELHEALMQGGDGEGEQLVGDVLRQGYTMKGRVIRPVGVKVVRR
jgi:molecular chaperone GrpE